MARRPGYNLARAEQRRQAREGVERKTPGRKRTWTDEDRVRVIALAKEHTTAEIAEMMGRSHDTVYEWLRSWGVRPVYARPQVAHESYARPSEPWEIVPVIEPVTREGWKVSSVRTDDEGRALGDAGMSKATGRRT